MVLCLKTRESRTLPGYYLMKNIIVVTGGSWICWLESYRTFLKKTNKKIISIDNYSTGLKKNHFKNKRVKYI